MHELRQNKSDKNRRRYQGDTDRQTPSGQTATDTRALSYHSGNDDTMMDHQSAGERRTYWMDRDRNTDGDTITDSYLGADVA